MAKRSKCVVPGGGGKVCPARHSVGRLNPVGAAHSLHTWEFKRHVVQLEPADQVRAGQVVLPGRLVRTVVTSDQLVAAIVDHARQLHAQVASIGDCLLQIYAHFCISVKVLIIIVFLSKLLTLTVDVGCE